MSVTWPQRIDAARSESDVVEAVREYVATVTPHEFAALPEGLRPHKIVDADDVTALAFELVCHTSGDAEPAVLLHKLAAIFSHASIRLSEVMARRNDEDQTEPRTA